MASIDSTIAQYLAVHLYIKADGNQAIPLIPVNQLPIHLAKKYGRPLSSAREQGIPVFVIDPAHIDDYKSISGPAKIITEQRTPARKVLVIESERNDHPDARSTADNTDRGIVRRSGPRDYDDHPQNNSRQTDVPKPGKVYCTHWMRYGECDFTQQGCKYKHEMPGLEVMEHLGFRNYPRWFLDEQYRAQSARGRSIQRARRGRRGIPPHEPADADWQSTISATRGRDTVRDEKSLIDLSPTQSPNRASRRFSQSPAARLSRSSSTIAVCSQLQEDDYADYDAGRASETAPSAQDCVSTTGSKRGYMIRRGKNRSTTWISPPRKIRASS